MGRARSCIAGLGLALALGVTGCVTTQERAVQQGATVLDGAALKALVAGARLVFADYHDRARVDFRPDHTLFAENDLGEKSPGTWRLDGDQLCIAFQRWDFGRERCTTVLARPDGVYLQFASPRRLLGRFTVERPAAPTAAPVAETARRVPTQAPAPPPPPTPAALNPAAAPPPPPAPPSPHAPTDNAHLLAQLARDCAGCNLAGARLAGHDLRGAHLRGANLAKADLARADLRGADLRGANLAGARLAGADLRDADLHNANLAGADLTGARLAGADLTGANLP